ncbi:MULTISPECIES: hypothetical protein [unclassified Polaromonas]|uniref:hypothetical protein n=1 Tax=unclassified Polaromonas TaxID=2638319 RepID=UPI0018CA55A3|nr:MULTISPECIES: hypothetical protein [unclassified Polaromonas]MBG6074071.1 hypothetical protein [Polaromonas sp. CG_9.7]MBG6116094.1 hypothetical protein [Polaromonas sp. CG_9.2]MDH6186527.1 hypothetical protein [Polaromonas sp. CG_23.6]MDH6186828.1 hypothetical protein [Polaromonas sp. CG_23.6]
MSTQKDYLQATKKALRAKTWDALAEMAGVAPRALKTYRMPDDSGEYRGMPNPVKKVFDLLLEKNSKKNVE